MNRNDSGCGQGKVLVRATPTVAGPAVAEVGSSGLHWGEENMK